MINYFRTKLIQKKCLHEWYVIGKYSRDYVQIYCPICNKEDRINEWRSIEIKEKQRIRREYKERMENLTK